VVRRNRREQEDCGTDRLSAAVVLPHAISTFRGLSVSDSHLEFLSLHCLRGTLTRYQRIGQMKEAYPIEALCAAFCVSRSGFYQWLEREQNPSPRQLEDRILADQIGLIHRESRGTYGTPRLQAELKARGRRHGRKRTDRIRRELGLSGRAKRRYRPKTTDSSQSAWRAAFSHPARSNLAQ
jgi:hypothetical protein